jgi:hypothetical protein
VRNPGPGYLFDSCGDLVLVGKFWDLSTVELTETELAHRANAATQAGFRKFSKKISCIARSRRACAGLTVYPPRIQIADVEAASSQSCDRKSKFGLRHAIELIELYCMTKSEFWFSMIPPSTSYSNNHSFVLLNSTVPAIDLSTFHVQATVSTAVYTSANVHSAVLSKCIRIFMVLCPWQNYLVWMFM